MPWNETTRGKYKRDSARYESDLSDEEWNIVEPLLPPPSKLGRRRAADLRQICDAIQHMLSAGRRRRAIPKCFPPFTAVQNYFYAWRNDGTFEAMTDALRELARGQAERSPEPTAAVTGSRPVKTTESGGPSGHGAGRKIKGRKRHIAVDTEGTPIMITVHTAEAQDRDGAPGVITGMLEKAPEVTKLWADGGCQGPEPAPEAGGAGPWRPPGNRGKTEGNQRAHRPVPPMGRGADVFLDVRGAGGWRRISGGPWRVRWRGAGWRPAGSSCVGWRRGSFH